MKRAKVALNRLWKTWRIYTLRFQCLGMNLEWIWGHIRSRSIFSNINRTKLSLNYLLDSSLKRVRDYNLINSIDWRIPSCSAFDLFPRRLLSEESSHNKVLFRRQKPTKTTVYFATLFLLARIRWTTSGIEDRDPTSPAFFLKYLTNAVELHGNF